MITYTLINKKAVGETELKLITALGLTLSLILVSACVSNRVVIKVNSVDDIPDIKNVYANKISQLEKGMSYGKLQGLFPYAEKECYPSGVCNLTIFQEDLVQIDKRIGDLNMLTGSLISLLALTCIISDEDCTKAVVAALNVGIASAVESNRIQTSKNNSDIVTLLQWINIEIVDNKVSQWAINEPLAQFKPKSYKNELPDLDDALKNGN